MSGAGYPPNRQPGLFGSQAPQVPNLLDPQAPMPLSPAAMQTIGAMQQAPAAQSPVPLSPAAMQTIGAMHQQAPAAPPQQQQTGRNGLAVGTIKNFHRYTGGDPSQPTSWDPLRGDDFLSELSKQSPAFAARVKAMADGRLPVQSGFGSNSAPDAILMKNALAMYDPDGMDSIVNGTRAATRKNFSANGEAMQNIRNLNQAIGHLNQYASNIPKVAGHQIPGIGNFVNWAENSTAQLGGDPGIMQLGADRTALSNELASVFKGKGASSEAEVSKFYDQLDPNFSTPQKQGNVRELVGLMESRLQTLADQYNQGMGQSVTPVHFLTPESQRAWSQLKNLGLSKGSAPSGGGGGGAVQIKTAADYAKLPSGSAYIDPQGVSRVKK